MENCLFCKIINKEIPSTIVYEDEEILAFKDINPIAPVHILVIPKKHFNDISEVSEKDSDIIAKIHLIINKIAKEQGIADSGYRIINNCKEDVKKVMNNSKVTDHHAIIPTMELASSHLDELKSWEL